MSIFSDHHIIPYKCKGPSTSSGIDLKTFDIDSPVNRIYLPANREFAAELKVSPHPGGHVEPYIRLICDKLDKIADIESPDEQFAEIKILIDAMRVGFLNGHLYTNIPVDKTREEVVQWIEKIVEDPKAYLGIYPDQLRTVRDIEQRAAAAGQDHLIKWLLYLGHPERQKLIDEAIARDPDVNLTERNRHLGGTPWSKFEVFDPSSDILQTPGSRPPDPRDFQPLPGYSSPSLAGLDKQEGRTRIDPSFTGALPAFPAVGRNEQQFDRLPPTVAAPSDPLVLTSDPATGTSLPFYDNPLAGGTSVARDALPWLAGAAAAGAAAPFIPAWLLGIGGIVALSRAATAEESSPGAPMSAATPSGGVFSTGASAHGTIGNGLNVDNAAGSRGSTTVEPQLGGTSWLDLEAPTLTFADRFGNWAGTVPVTDVSEAAPAPAAGSVAPENVRRLARVNESNAGSVFTSGSAPVPYLPSTEFNERFGSWTVPTAGNGQPQSSKPIGTFADEPSYFIPPPIFGVGGPGNPSKDAEEWFSRWIRPLFTPE